MENGGLRGGLEGAADKSHLSRMGKGNSLCDISIPRRSDALNMSERKGRKGVGRAGLLRRQPAKAVSFHVFAARFGLRSPCAGDRGFSSWGWQMEWQRLCPAGQRGMRLPPSHSPTARIFSLKH